MDHINALLRLSLRVLPLFVEASQTQARRCRRDSRLQAFYTRVASALVTSNSVLTNLHQRSSRLAFAEQAQDLLLSLLTKLLHLLEKTANVQTNSIRADLYPKLQGLPSPRSQSLHDPYGLLRFRLHGQALTRKKFQSVLDRIVLRLMDLIHTDQVVQNSLVEWVPEGNGFDSVSPEPIGDTTEPEDTMLIDELEPILLHRAIADRWLCQCPSRDKAKLRLTSCCSVGPSGKGAKFDMMLSTHFEPSRWQRACIQLSRSEGKAVQFATHESGPPSKVAFVSGEALSIRSKVNLQTSVATDSSKNEEPDAKHKKTSSITNLSSFSFLKKRSKKNTPAAEKSTIISSISIHAHGSMRSSKQKTAHSSECVRHSAAPEQTSSSAQVAPKVMKNVYGAETGPISMTAGFDEITQGGICRLLRNNGQRLLISFLAANTSQGLSLRGGFEKCRALDNIEILPLSSALTPSQGRNSGSNIQLMSTSIQSKLILANVLAHAVMQLYGSPWASRKWTKDRFSFALETSHHKSLNAFVELYMSSELDEQNHQGLMDSLQSLHPQPRLLDLGIMLLEIELESPIENERQSSDLGAGGQLLDCTDLSVADRLLRSERLSTTFSDYRSAVMACINAQECASQDVHFVRRWIKQRIVKPLSGLLWHCFRMSVAADGIHQDGQLLKDVETADTRIDIPFMEFDSEDISGASVEMGQFLDCEKHFAADQSDQSQSSDWWFEQLAKITLPHIDALKKQQTSPTGPNIRIAILDTGIDARRVMTPKGERIVPDHPFLKAHARRVKGLGIWHAGIFDETTTEMKDHHGHGTHAAALILKIALDADVYIAQVDRGKEIFEPDPSSIAEAIKHATSEWKVDIITMSFGFSTVDTTIYEAIRHAHDHNVLMFAAASNGGAIFGETFPATCDEVISIRSANGYGKSSGFNPNVSEYSQVSHFYKTIGENVLSAWPGHLGEGLQKRQTGSSIATPIAAAVVALFLEYVQIRSAVEGARGGGRQNSRDLWQKLRFRHSAFGIRAALRCMSERDKDESLYFVMPWLLMSSRGNAQWERLKTL